MTEKTLKEIYRPRHDEASRQAFVGALKGYLNGPLEARLAKRYEDAVKPGYAKAHGRAPKDRLEGTEAFRGDHLFQLWGSSVFTSQDLMWETVGETCDRLLPEFEARREALARREPLGRLELKEDFVPPDPIRQVEIHRQPGGYFGQPGDASLRRGMDYMGTGELYRAAKGLSEGDEVGDPGMGNYLLGALRRRFAKPDPASLLDMGCGVGVHTIAYKQAFPKAEVWGVDLSGPFLQFAHVWAEDKGLAINYRQANANETGFADGQFDLIVSHIMFHETWHDILPGIMAEAHRLLAPGGIFLNGDTPYQPNRLSITKQVTNHWQVVNNGEPFWTGYADTDMRQALIDGGFDAEHVFAEYDPLGSGEYHIFGGVKT
ncbi:MAG: class I SAM-dependent methyltransferase [Gammaproteobacteria bacterium]|nr:class I SAM-dependent methyltransferase [Gammaproteobacteria bacterium]MCY4255461.1 class I SAM-dependent methyltransferase [Gammaproteobacteria bacterium]MCY4340222.1 class I SAM-dependent methyltransferase [Gammaproteobacteria bacterium]